MNRNNQNYKRIRAALQLSKHDVYEIFGGLVSKSIIDAWSRSELARKNATGNSSSTTVARFRAMSDQQFDDFCTGLLSWCKEDQD